MLSRSAPTRGQPEKAIERTAEALVQALGNFGVEAHVSGQVVGPRVTRYELQLAPGTKVGKVASLKDDLAYALATTEIRILAPIPGKQAVGVEVPEPRAQRRHARGHLRRAAANASPLSVWLGKDISGARLGRPRAHAAHPHRRHDRLGEVGLHQHDALLDPPARDPGRGAHDPRRPEARRARPLRVDPAPPDAGRLEPEGRLAVLTNVLTEMERRYERMSLARARNLAELNRVLAGAASRRCRTSSSSSTSSPT